MFSNAIPQPNHQLNNSQKDLLDNFIAIQNLIGINHVNFNVTGEGKHTQVTLPENVAPTNTAIDEANIYSQLSTLTAQTELFWQRENNGTRIEWTGLLAAQTGWTRLPSGILLKWGLVPTNAAPTIIVFPVAATIPPFNLLVPNNPFTVLAIAVDNNNQSTAQINAGSVTSLQFSVETWENIFGIGPSPIASNIYYLALGI